MSRLCLYTLQVSSSASATAAIYARISADKVGESLGVKRQVEDCERLAKERGFQRTRVYVDNDVSAYSGKPRREYLRMLRDIQSGEVAAVFTWHNDRLHRSPLELEHYIELSESLGVVTYTVRAGVIDFATPAGRMMARQLGTIARYESEHRSERIRRKALEKAKNGEYHGGAVRPFGFETDGVTHRDSEARELRRMTQAALAGHSLGSIIRDLNARQVTSVRGNPWSYTTMRALLLRPRNAGLRQHQGQVIGEAAWEPIVAKSEFLRLERLLRDPSRRTTRNSQRRHLLSGIAKCGVCGAGMKSGGSKTRTGTPFKVYRCCTTRNLEKMERLIEGCARSVLLNQTWHVPSDLGSDREELLEQIASIDSRALEAADAYAAATISVRQLSLINEKLDLERADLETRLSSATPADYEFFVGLPGDLEYDSLPLERRRKLVEALFDIRVMPVGKGSNKRGLTVADGVDITFLGLFAHTYTDLETMLMAARLSPAQVAALRDALYETPLPTLKDFE